MLVCASGGPKAARKLAPQIEATCEHDGRILSRAEIYGIGKRLRQEIESIFAVKLCQETLRPLAGGVKASSGAQHADDAGGVGAVPTTTADGLPHSG